jgi:Uma2 family endonuclease
MTLAATKPPVGQPGSQTVEDYFALRDTRGWELDDGRLVEKNVGTMSSWMAGELHFLIRLFLRDHQVGRIFPADTAYKCYPAHPDRIRKPDASFISYGRLTGDQETGSFITVAPDLVVEVVSPNDTVFDVDRKVTEYLEAGVKLIWVVNPDVRTVRILRADGTVDQIDERGRVSGEDVLPGFSFAVADLFPKSIPA